MAPISADEVVAKGTVTRCLDELSVAPDARERLVALRDGILGIRDVDFRGLEEVFATYLFPGFYDAAQIRQIVEYLRRHWFNEETGWWPRFQPIAPMYAHGLLQTLRSSLAAPKEPRPIDSYWLIDHTAVELINLVSPRQVTLLIATPPPGEVAPGGILSESSEVWVTARRAGRPDQEIDATTGQPAAPTTELRIRTFKIRTRAPRRP